MHPQMILPPQAKRRLRYARVCAYMRGRALLVMMCKALGALRYNYSTITYKMN